MHTLCHPLTLADEVSAVVVDFGSHTTRAGWAGEDSPRVVTPSFYGYADVPQPSGSGSTSNGTATDAPANGDDPMDGTGDESKVGATKRKYYFGDDGVGVWRNGMEVGNFMVDGIGGCCKLCGADASVNDGEAAGNMLKYLLRDRLSVDPSEHPLFLTEPAWNSPKARETLTQIAFEQEEVPALYFGSSGVLSA